MVDDKSYLFVFIRHCALSQVVSAFSFFASVRCRVRSAKIFISTAEGQPAAALAAFCEKTLLKHCIQIVRKHEGLVLTRSLE